jgi:fructose-1,6-bisphosphatase I
MYPATTKDPSGKLRLVYECNPFAFILDVAGGMATNGKESILTLLPDSLHQRSAFFAGSRKMMITPG